MDEKVAELKHNRAINNEMLELLDAIRGQVEQGTITGFGIVVVEADNTTGNAFIGGPPSSLLFELLVLQREIMDCRIDLRLHMAGEDY